MLFARESRLIKRTKLRYWKILASIIAELMIKSTYQAMRFYLRLKARGFDTTFIMNNNYRIASFRYNSLNNINTYLVNRIFRSDLIGHNTGS